MAQLSNIIIGVLLIGLITSGIGIFLGNVALNYSVDNVENHTFMQVFINESASTRDLMEQTEEKLLQVEDDESSVFDRIGAFFRGGYDAVKLLFSNFGSLSRIVNTGVSEIDFLGAFGNILSSTIIAIILVVFAIGLLLNYLIKSDRT